MEQKKKVPVLTIRDLSITFRTTAGPVNAIRGVNIDLMRGETLAIVGESGSGKSVTFKAVMGILAKNSEVNSGSGQLMAYIWDSEGRLCDWGIPRTECYGARLPADWRDEVPSNLLIVDVPAAEYLVFEHGPFDYEQENRTVEEKIERAMATFDFEGTGYCYDDEPGRILYFYFDPGRFWKYVRPVRRCEE